MFADWMWSSWEQAGLIVLSALLMVVSVIALIRLFGLRSFSKMSSFDFAVTVAVGSVLAGTVSTSTPYLNGVLSVAALFAVQWAVAQLRGRAGAEAVVDNAPLLLMRDGELLNDALVTARVTESDVIAKLREANVLAFDEVQAVVLETTGDISVLHGDRSVEEQLLAGVRVIGDSRATA